MDANVASFDEFDNDQQIAAHQAGLPRIVLEGDTDVKLFSRFWFPSWQETFEFIEACKVGAGSGCTGVADAVARSRQDGIPAVGIVDRDMFFRNKEWARLFSLDAVAPLQIGLLQRFMLRLDGKLKPTYLSLTFLARG